MLKMQIKINDEFIKNFDPSKDNSDIIMNLLEKISKHTCDDKNLKECDEFKSKTDDSNDVKAMKELCRDLCVMLRNIDNNWTEYRERKLFKHEYIDNES